jgi:hypothetical protein
MAAIVATGFCDLTDSSSLNYSDGVVPSLLVLSTHS